MPRKHRRPSTQTEISVTLRLLRLQLKRHPQTLRMDAIEECIRQLRELQEEEKDQVVERLTGLPVE